MLAAGLVPGSRRNLISAIISAIMLYLAHMASTSLSCLLSDASRLGSNRNRNAQVNFGSFCTVPALDGLNDSQRLIILGLLQNLTSHIPLFPHLTQPHPHPHLLRHALYAYQGLCTVPSFQYCTILELDRAVNSFGIIGPYQ
jgi:hypothetical protein